MATTIYPTRSASPGVPAKRRPAAPAAVRPNTRSRRRTRAITRSATALEQLRGRVVQAFLLIALLYLLIGVRLWSLQVGNHQARRVQERRSLPNRGMLLDRTGAVLVGNARAATIVVDQNAWHVSQNPAQNDTADTRQDQVLTELSSLLPDFDSHVVTAVLGVRGQTGRLRTVDVAQRVPWETAQRIQAANLPGVGIIETTRREAVNGPLAAQVLGFTRRDGIGGNGLEEALQAHLVGQPGIERGEFDRRGMIPGTLRSEVAERPGTDFMLTLDARLQNIAQQALGRAFQKAQAEAATAVVLDPKSGDILALVNYPACDVNRRELYRDGQWQNRAVSTPYEPGSTLKVMTIAAALQEKLISPDTSFYCSGYKKIGRRTIRCAHGAKHGAETTRDVIRESCNIASAECAFKLGAEKLYDYAHRFGFGQATGVELPEESRGRLDDPAANPWSQIRLANVGFGQGITVTPLQLAAAYATIANDGVWMRPRILMGTRGSGGTIRPFPLNQGRHVLSPEVARTMRRMLESVIEDGTGKMAQLDGYSAGGKTGTAQIAENGHYGSKYVSSFVGMAPIDQPRYVILVAVRAPKGAYYGGTVAAPVFQEIAQKAMLLYRVPEDRPARRLAKKTASVGVRD